MAYYKESEFVKWLINDTVRWSDPTSVSSYKSGVSRLLIWINNNKGLWKPNGKVPVLDFEDYLKAIDNVADRETLFSAALNILQKAINKKGTYTNKSLLQNYKSYLSAYEEFFRTEPFSGTGIAAAQKKLLRMNSSEATYTQDELISELIKRILSQDRISMSMKVLFPIRLIRKLWKKDTEVWAKSVCENIWLIVQNSSGKREVQIKDIELLRIKRTGFVDVIIKNDKNIYTLCTSYSDPHETIVVNNNVIQFYRKRTPLFVPCSILSNGIIIDKNQNIKDAKKKDIILWHVQPMKITTIGDIAIDHDVPISQVLIDNEKQLKLLKKLSDEYRIISGQLGLKVTAKEVNSFCKNIQNGSKEETQLLLCCNNKFPKADMDIIGKCRLVLMGKKENSMKSDN